MKKILTIALIIGFSTFLLYHQWTKNNGNEEVIIVGALVPLTGNSAVAGKMTLNGLKMAIEEQNKQGGLLGKKIHLIAEDTKAKPNDAVSIINKFEARQNSPAVYYSIISGVAMAIKGVTEKKNKILISAVGADKYLVDSKLTLRNFVDPVTIGKEITNYLADSLNVKTVGVYYANTEYGKTVLSSFTKEAERKNLTISLAESYSETDTDFKNIVLKNKRKKIDYYYVVGIGKSLGYMIRDIKTYSPDAKIIGDEMIPYPDVLTSAGRFIKDVYYLDFDFSNLAERKDDPSGFYQKYKSIYAEEPKSLSVLSYEAMKLYFKSVSKANTLDSKEVYKKFNAINNYEGVSGKISVSGGNILYQFLMRKMN